MITRTAQEIEAEKYIPLLEAIKPSACSSIDAEFILEQISDVPTDPLTVEGALNQSVVLNERWLQKEMREGSCIKRFLARLIAQSESASNDSFLKTMCSLFEEGKANGKTETDFFVEVFCHDYPKTADLVSSGVITTLKQLFFARTYEECVLRH